MSWALNKEPDSIFFPAEKNIWQVMLLWEQYHRGSTWKLDDMESGNSTTDAADLRQNFVTQLQILDRRDCFEYFEFCPGISLNLAFLDENFSIRRFSDNLPTI